jgi:hypothetical protein
MHDSPGISQFLSMKLAAVNPQLGLNIKQLLSKDVSNLQTHLQFFVVLSFFFSFARNAHQNYKMSLYP